MSNAHRYARHDTDRTVSSCLVWRCELSRPDSQTGAFCVWSVSECVRRRSQNALVRRSIHTRTPNKTRLPRLPVDRCRDAGQAERQTATPSRPTVHTQRRCTPRKYKHALDCCIRLGPNFFTDRHAMRVIYRQTVQTLPDGLETQFTPPDTTQTGLSSDQLRAASLIGRNAVT